MALAYLLDPSNQYQNDAGVNNVAGYFEVFLMDTDDRATVYTDFNGTLAPAHIGIDNNGRAVMVVDSSKVYRVEMHGPNGKLMWTQKPVWTQSSGGGAVGSDVISSDGTILVDRYNAGGITTFDLSTDVEDSTELLNWIRCEGATHLDGGDIWKPTYSAGTMVVGTRGIRVNADQFYHVTAHVRATKTSASPYYDNVYLLYSFDDGTSVTPVTRQSVIVDCSLGLSQDFEFSTDVMAVADGELLFSIVGQDQAGISFDVLDMELHRVYSGAPHLPDGYGRTEQADWAEDDPAVSSFIRNKPDLSLYVTDSEMETILSGYATTAELAEGLATKQDVINDLSEIRSGAAAGATALQSSDVAAVAVSGDYDDLINRPTIPSGAQLVPAATSADADKVLTVDAQGVPAWAAAQAPISAGDGIDITNNVVSAKVDGTTVTVNASGELQAAPAITVDQTYDPTSTNPQSGTAVAGAVANKQDTISDLQTIREGASAGATAVQPGSLATVAFTGDYSDLLNRPTIPDNVACFAWDSNRQFPLISYNAALAAYNANKVLVLFDYGRDTPSSAKPVAVTSQYEFGTTTEQVDFVKFRYDGINNGSGQASYSVTYTAYSSGNLSKYTKWFDIGKVDDVKVNGSSVLDSDNVAQITLPDFSQYATTSAMNTALAGKQDTLTAGSNISISGSTISATDTTYSAGTGLDLTGTTFSVDSTTVAMKSDLPDLTDYVTDTELSTILQGYQEALTAGSNIQISNGTISATDTTYTAGTGLDLTGTEFSVDTTTIATKSDLSDYTPTASLAAVALSNDYDDLDNKPTIPVVPPTKELVAGNNITLTEGANDVTVACTVTIGTVSV